MCLTRGDFYLYCVDMYLRRNAETIATNVANAIASNDTPKESVAQAADMTADDLVTQLTEPGSFEALVAVGGFLHVHPSTFFEGVTA